MIDWLPTDYLRGASVLVVGAGAIGNEVLKNLCLLGIGKIHIVDFDSIEIHNLTKTVLFTDREIGHSKAEAAAVACKSMNPDVDVSWSNGDLWKAVSLSTLAGYSVVFCCVDNFESRIRLNNLCLITGTYLINAGIDSRYVVVENYPFSAGYSGPCYECGLPPTAYQKIAERYSCSWLKKKGFEEKSVPTTIMTSSIAGAVMVSLFGQRNHPDRPSDHAVRFFMDTITLISNRSVLEKNPECVSCSTYGRPWTIVQSKREIRMGGFPLVEPTAVLHLVDPIVVAGKCKHCEKEVAYFDLAADLDDTVTICENCHLHSVDISIISTISIKDLMDHYGGRYLPGKFVTFESGPTSYLIELED
jgi:hypothetical protein